MRLIHLAQISASPLGGVLFLDARLYDEWAGRILTEGFSAGRPLFVEPGYALLLALFKAAGVGPAGTRLAQAALGLGIVWLTARVARRLGGSTAAGAAALVAALYLPLIYFEGLILKTTLEVFLSMLLIERILALGDLPTAGRALLAGAAAGAGLVVRSTLLPIAAAGAVWAALGARREGRPRAAVTPLLMLALPAAALAGLAASNRISGGEWTPFPYNSGINFYIGNCRGCNGVDAGYPFGRGVPEHEEEDSRLEAERRAGRPLGFSGSSAFWWRETAREIVQDPGRWMALMGTKLLLWWNRYEITDNQSLYFMRQHVPVLRWPLPGYWLAAPLGCAGLAAAWLLRADRAWAFTGCALLIQMGLVVSFHVAERYRLPAVPLMLAMGCAALAR
ncbi:MAG TPA: hypothetical protein VJV23_02705, partial [Candidatus Polarisedimenticolia bacterium]|nr:hypothetical protein [Candidatus Polarisedimenticolia bacterium]